MRKHVILLVSLFYFCHASAQRRPQAMTIYGTINSFTNSEELQKIPYTPKNDVATSGVVSVTPGDSNKHALRIGFFGAGASDPHHPSPGAAGMTLSIQSDERNGGLYAETGSGPADISHSDKEHVSYFSYVYLSTYDLRDSVLYKIFGDIDIFAEGCGVKTDFWYNAFANFYLNQHVALGLVSEKWQMTGVVLRFFPVRNLSFSGGIGLNNKQEYAVSYLAHFNLGQTDRNQRRRKNSWRKCPPKIN